MAARERPRRRFFSGTLAAGDVRHGVLLVINRCGFPVEGELPGKQRVLKQVHTKKGAKEKAWRSSRGTSGAVVSNHLSEGFTNASYPPSIERWMYPI